MNARTHRLDTNNCTVHAVRHALAVGYESAHAELARRGRKRYKGMRLGISLQRDPHLFGRRVELEYYYLRSTNRLSADSPEGARARRYGRPVYPRIRLSTFMKRNPTGRFILGIRGHALALVNGKLSDGTSRHSLLNYAWRVPTLLLPAPRV
jgi:hypothetical protein